MAFLFPDSFFIMVSSPESSLLPLIFLANNKVVVSGPMKLKQKREQQITQVVMVSYLSSRLSSAKLYRLFILLRKNTELKLPVFLFVWKKLNCRFMFLFVGTV